RHHELELTVYNLLVDHTVSTEEVLASTRVEGVDLIPANIDLSAAEIQLVNEVGREQALGRALYPVLDRYDFVLIDCQPSLGLLTVNALACADGVLIPMECEYFALRGLALLTDTIDKVRDRINPRLHLTGILITMFDRRTVHARDVLGRVVEVFGEKVSTRWSRGRSGSRRRRWRASPSPRGRPDRPAHRPTVRSRARSSSAGGDGGRDRGGGRGDRGAGPAGVHRPPDQLLRPVRPAAVAHRLASPRRDRGGPARGDRRVQRAHAAAGPGGRARGGDRVPGGGLHAPRPQDGPSGALGGGPGPGGPGAAAGTRHAVRPAAAVPGLPSGRGAVRGTRPHGPALVSADGGAGRRVRRPAARGGAGGGRRAVRHDRRGGLPPASGRGG